jgi:very-short-patch-repair endonuclease
MAEIIQRMQSEMKQVFAAYADEIADLAKSDFNEKIERVGSRCESPIELMFLGAFIVELAEDSPDLRVDFLNIDHCIHYHEKSCCFIAQADLGQYRTDFFIEMAFNRNVWLRVAIECDGHEFHERTKEQARRDRRRDRWMQLNGIAIFRFTGSELWKDAKDCAQQILQFLNRRQEEESERLSDLRRREP